ncbi:UDP-N-acetylmuramoyl-L-alanine--D-glutamate ligase [Pediococcus pentosaceus]|uniref:UDP-N-acetylmuramoyl-L-alanine--D-glutamate ligase n=1 Tax=Pediococcus pentosaceus TaxID=1255 RepID=UPI0006D896F6|nr:UDP-N-acetylmuramoyl-L-alanine--D-glutamate ligase [Pediococcus pentosaceus]ANI97735.1 UDP-N-acetylmuramoyl-L-alanine--D-glutamate ligase [Pediococcus pentosaceus]ASC08246.1 UDP-N-acetylmuramoyl-L-alanine--D-glutamate ligase [Pediococcus pentosaceus]AVL01682.1 UDP-N-acetylmuramoyl-L-alanine--D-glutamate ligase [Pediococcus pentosaceus]KQB80935.1 UDP-N-acetylmuramoylalanine--D-glutamate ligase [Pediococcus pentosaceus]MBF7112320.1 UDP-N-acetylmuramoyl-L-alanine--D-glutamate ligase [Pediococc
MKSVEDLEDKNVLVLGMAKSGVSAALLLHRLRANVLVNDANANQPQELIEKLENKGIRMVLGEHPTNILSQNKIELIVKNPGIPYTNPVLVDAQARGIKIVSEPELAYWVMDSELIGVTGSNGKTTVTTLIQLMLDDNKKHAYVAGNIGVPATTVAQKATAEDKIVMELSSFMLAGIDRLHPHIAVLNNIFASHLDWHKTRENYVNDKMNITKNQTKDDFLVINWDNTEWQELAKRTQAKVVPFSRQGLTKSGAYEIEGKLYFKDELIMEVDEIGIPGEQNVENALAAIAVAKIEKVSTAHIKQVLTTFGGVKHRIQYVENLNGRQFYNDSKATDIEATQVALRSFKKPVILIAGGLDRHDDLDRLIPDLEPNVKEVIVNGETAEKFKKIAQKAGISVIKDSSRVSESVEIAYQDSKEGDIILLSPAAASWDQYKTFEERGDEFIAAVQNLHKGE